MNWITRECRGIDANCGVVCEDEQADGRRPRERVALDAPDVVVAQVETGEIVQSGEGELTDALQRSVLQWQFLESR